MVPEPILSLAEAQRGVIARYQVVHLAGAGVADYLMRSRWCGPLDPPVRGVRRVRGGAGLDEQQAFAAALRARPKATITGPIVLGLLGVGEIDTDAPFEILVNQSRRLSNVPFPYRVDPDPDRPVMRHGHVRLANPLDALIDSAAFAAQLGERPLRVAWDQLRWRGIAHTDRLVRRIEELDGSAPGAARLRDVLELGGGAGPESEGERKLGRVLDCFEPRPEPQIWVTPSRRVDWYFRHLRLGYEYLGRVDHATSSGRIRDDARDRELREEGVRLHYVTAEDLREPRSLLATVAGALTVRAHELAASPPIATRHLDSP